MSQIWHCHHCPTLFWNCLELVENRDASNRRCLRPKRRYMRPRYKSTDSLTKGSDHPRSVKRIRIYMDKQWARWQRHDVAVNLRVRGRAPLRRAGYMYITTGDHQARPRNMTTRNTRCDQTKRRCGTSVCKDGTAAMKCRITVRVMVGREHSRTMNAIT
jgi:hypothetical protein